MFAEMNIVISFENVAACVFFQISEQDTTKNEKRK